MVATEINITRKTKVTLLFRATSERELFEQKALIQKGGNRSKSTFNKENEEWETVVYTNVGQALDFYQEVDLAYNFCDLPEFEDFTLQEIEEHLQEL